MKTVILNYMEDMLSFGKVHIIEWLRPGERRTGQESYRELKSILTANKSPVEAHLHRVSTVGSFRARLQRIEKDFRTNGRVPLLQIETHGDDDDGIGPSEVDWLTWPQLMEALTPLNQATGVRLTVVLAACHGIWGIKMAQPMERSPFMALLGPNRKVYPGEIVRGMRAFYRGVFEHKDGGRAMQMLNNMVDPDKTTFGIFNCEQLFRDVWDGYLADTSSEDQVSARVEHAVTLMLAKGDQPPTELAAFRTYMRNYILDYETHFQASRRHFFFIDLFPANDARFNLTLKLAPVEADTAGSHLAISSH